MNTTTLTATDASANVATEIEGVTANSNNSWTAQGTATTAGKATAVSANRATLSETETVSPNSTAGGTATCTGVFATASLGSSSTGGTSSAGNAIEMSTIMGLNVCVGMDGAGATLNSATETQIHSVITTRKESTGSVFVNVAIEGTAEGIATRIQNVPETPIGMADSVNVITAIIESTAGVRKLTLGGPIAPEMLFLTGCFVSAEMATIKHRPEDVKDAHTTPIGMAAAAQTETAAPGAISGRMGDAFPGALTAGAMLNGMEPPAAVRMGTP